MNCTLLKTNPSRSLACLALGIKRRHHNVLSARLRRSFDISLFSALPPPPTLLQLQLWPVEMAIIIILLSW